MAWLSSMTGDYVLARLHGRRSQFAQGPLLAQWCDASSYEDLCTRIPALLPALPPTAAERRLHAHDAAEIHELCEQYRGARSNLLRWMLARFRMENLKTLLRARRSRTPVDKTRELLLPLPEDQAPLRVELSAAVSIEAFIRELPDELFKTTLENRPAWSAEYELPAMEYLLESAYHTEALRRCGELPAPESHVLRPLFEHDAAQYIAELVLRGRHGFGLPAALLSGFYVPQACIKRPAFAAMLTAKDAEDAARVLNERYFHATMGSRDPDSLSRGMELRKSNLARRARVTDPLAFPAVVGFLFLRKSDTRRLITLLEGQRRQMRGVELLRRVERGAREEPAVHV